MTVNYKGAEKNFSWRLAEVCFDDKEFTLVERMAQLLHIKGWTNFEIVTENYASCAVDDMKEYAEFVKDYKAVKKCIKNCMRFGF